MVNSSIFDPVFSYMACYRSDEVGWSFLGLGDQSILYNFTARRVHLLMQEVVPGRKKASEHRLSDRLLGLVPVRYSEGPSPTLEKASGFLRNLLSRLVPAVWQVHPPSCMVP